MKNIHLVTVRLKDGTIVTYPGSDIESVMVEQDVIEEHAYVDLGLPSGTQWATTNVGASSPEEIGEYFAWGETEPKKTYNWKTLKYYLDNINKFTKYNFNKDRGIIDSLSELEKADDAACVNWGSNWRTPSYDQWVELKLKCNWTWTKEFGVAGCLVTGKNGNSIFLPTTGYRYNSSAHYVESCGHYWSRTLSFDSTDSYSAWRSYFVPNNFKNYPALAERLHGYCIRPVRISL